MKEYSTVSLWFQKSHSIITFVFTLNFITMAYKQKYLQVSCLLAEGVGWAAQKAVRTTRPRMKRERRRRANAGSSFRN